MIKRTLLSLLGGVGVQVALLLTMILGPRLVADGSTLNELLARLNLLAMPAFLWLWPQSTAEEVHPGFSLARLVSAVSIDIAVYSVVIFFLLNCWSTVAVRSSV